MINKDLDIDKTKYKVKYLGDNRIQVMIAYYEERDNTIMLDTWNEDMCYEIKGEVIWKCDDNWQKKWKLTIEEFYHDLEECYCFLYKEHKNFLRAEKWGYFY